MRDELLTPRERQLIEEIEQLRQRLEEPESTIAAIRGGEVDAFVVSERGEERVYTFHSADPPYRRIVDEMKEGAATLSADGTILYANRRLGELLGSPAERLRGSLLRDRVAKGFEAAFDALFAGAEGGRSEIDFRAAGGAVFPASVAVSAILDQDVTAFSAIVTDLTEQKASAQLAAAESVWREADRRKDEFLATLAHELRSPIAAIHRAAEIIDHFCPAEEKLRWACDVVRRQVENMARLVDDLLDVSRIATGKLTIRLETVDLAVLVPAIVAPVAPAFEEKRRSLSVSTPEAPVYAEVDSMRFAQVVTNLLQNAMKFTRPGGHVWITVAKEADRAVLTVRDDGRGITPEMQGRVFDLFEQGDRDRLAGSSESGLGIGLTLVRRLVELHGGTVDVESAGIGQGAAFAVRLPLSAGRRRVVPEEGSRPAAAATATRRILIVEDDPDLASGLAMLLQIHGHSVETAADGPAAIARCAELRPEVVLLDLGLPGMDGFEVARRLRPILERGAMIVALTGYGHEDDRMRAIEGGFDRHVVKPVRIEELAEILAEFGRARPG